MVSRNPGGSETSNLLRVLGSWFDKGGAIAYGG